MSSLPDNPYNPHAWIIGEPTIGEGCWIGAFTVIGLSSWMAPWLAALILVVLGLLLVVIFGILGMLRIKRMKNRENPAKALSTDARIVKEVADEF